MGKVMKKYEELTIVDDFMFGKVMRSPRRCKKLLEIILGIKIRKIEYIDDQDSIKPNYDAKGIRLDIYVEDSGNSVYNVEMQTENRDALPKRSRYYQSAIDINLLEKGTDYEALKKSYVIFICTFDLFGWGKPVYHFENLCLEEPSIRLGDGTERIFLNTKGCLTEVDEALRNILEYFDTLEPKDCFTRELDSAVAAARAHREWRREFMKLTLWEQDIMKDSRAEGLKEGALLKLISLICRKIKKGKTPEAIAEELDEDPEEVKRIYDTAISFAPDFDSEKIFNRLTDGQ